MNRRLFQVIDNKMCFAVNIIICVATSLVYILFLEVQYLKRGKEMSMLSFEG
jgi:hypothetical protein